MIATPPPSLGHVSLVRWGAIGAALIGPWAWLAALDWSLRRKLRSAPDQAR